MIALTAVLKIALVILRKRKTVLSADVCAEAIAMIVVGGEFACTTSLFKTVNEV